MLILSRENGQSITLHLDGKPIGRIMVCRIKGNHVRIGLDLDQRVTIARAELPTVPRRTNPSTTAPAVAAAPA